MRTLVFVAALGLLGAGPVVAQDLNLGLDLSQPEPEKKPAEPPQKPAKAPVKPVQQVELTERDVTLEDRVKSVQRRDVLKRRRLELAQTFAASVNDAFYAKYAVAASFLFYPHDSLGVGPRFMYFLTVPTWNVRTAKRDFQAQLPVSKPIWDAALDVQWTPFYGKVALFNRIAQFDLFLVGGIGVVASQTTFIQDGEFHFATDMGVGARATLGDFFAVQVSYLNTIYSDRPGGFSRSIIHNLGMVQIGATLFLPLRFEYEVH